MEIQSIVVAATGQIDEVRHRYRRVVSKQANPDQTTGGIKMGNQFRHEVSPSKRAQQDSEVGRRARVVARWMREIPDQKGGDLATKRSRAGWAGLGLRSFVGPSGMIR